MTFSVADGEAAGQEVAHVHMHLIPRLAGDGFGWKRHGHPADRVTLDAVAARLKDALG